MTMVISVVIIVVLIGVSFYFGMRVAENYAERRERAVDYALKKQYARLVAGMDADDTAQPYVSPDTNLPSNQNF